MDNVKTGKFFIWVGRLIVTLAFLTLIGAWITQGTGEPLWGMDQQHLYNDSMSLSLLGIAAFFCGFLHSKNL